MARHRFALLVATLPLLAACSSVRASAVRTGGRHLAEHAGPVAIYVAGESVPGTELGRVEVAATQSEGDLETLLPIFVQKAAKIGANAVVLDGVDARFEYVSRPYVETYTFRCGYGGFCTGSRMWSTNDEVMSVRMYGRAFSVPMVGERTP